MNETVKCARGALLDTWSGHDWKDGVQLETLDDLSKLAVHTENNLYEITVIAPYAGEVLVRGGKFFPEYTPARLAGSSLGGSFLKVRGIEATHISDATKSEPHPFTSAARIVNGELTYK